MRIRLPLAILLVVLAFLVGMLSERWVNSALREEALRQYERALDGFRAR